MQTTVYPANQACPTNPFEQPLSPISKDTNVEISCLSDKKERPAYSINQANSLDPSFSSSRTNIPDRVIQIKTNPSKRRDWSYWRMAPALMVLIACVTGVVCSLMWSFYLLIPFGPGFLASWYLLYRGCHDQELINLSENLEILESEIVQLDMQIDQFTAENQKLRKTQNDYVELHRKFNLTLEGFSNLKTGLDETGEEAKHNIKQLKDIASGIQHFDLTTFSTHIEALVKLIDDPDRIKARQEHINLIKEQVEIQTRMEVIAKDIEMNVEHIKDLKKIKEDLRAQVDRLSKEASRYIQAKAAFEQMKAEKANHTN